MKQIGEISDVLVIFQKNQPTEFGSGEVGDMGGRPPTDDFFLRKLRLSLEDFPDPDGEKIINYYHIFCKPILNHYHKYRRGACELALLRQ